MVKLIKDSLALDEHLTQYLTDDLQYTSISLFHALKSN